MIKKIILGTVQFGLEYGINNTLGKPKASEVYKMLEYAASNGVKTLDTADAYGNASELLGVFNKKNPGLFWINTKFKKTKESLELQLLKTLLLLNVNNINTYFYHSFSDFND